MICFARCQQKACIRIPDGATCKTGDEFICPQSCVYKNSICAKRTTFSVISVMNMEESSASKIRYLTYSNEEAASVFGGSVPAVQTSADKPSTATLNASPRTDKEKTLDSNGTAGSTLSKYQTMFGNFNSPKRQPENSAQNNGLSNNNLKPLKEYDRYIVGGKVFSDAAEVKAVQFALPLKNALREIFSYWVTTAVFASEKELKDEFIWLICTTSRRDISVSEINHILTNGEYTISQKFFYLFYDILFRYEQPRGFYWCDQRVSLNPLTAIFKDKQDFIKRYCDVKQRGEQFRSFFWQHEKEILHFLGCESEEKLFEDMTLILSKEEKQLVLIDKYNRYLPVNLGSLSEFIQNMRTPTHLAQMQNMVCFLEKYYVSKLGVSRRGLATPFEKSTSVKNDNGDRYEEDVTMYQAAKLLSSASYATEYDCYMTLLKEYVKVFSPNEVTIGELHFTKNNFSVEIRNIIFDFCKAHFGEADENVASKLQGKAWLAKSIYERGILSNFICENNSQIEEYFSLILPSAFNLENYYKVFPNPLFTFGRTDLTIHDYISQIIDTEDVYTAFGELNNDERIQKYFAVKIKTDFKMNLEQGFRAYQEQYDGFISK